MSAAVVPPLAPLLLLLLLLLCRALPSRAASPHWGDAARSPLSSAYDTLTQKLDNTNYRLHNDLLRQQDGGYKQSTFNEVEDFDYYMDAKSVNRAWSRDRLRTHQDYMNTHFVKLATKNMQLVLSSARCEAPTRRCLNVNKMAFGQPKTYWPNCALVHKCGHDSGCCKSPDHVCSPVQTQNIELYFFSIEQNKDKNTARVEKLTFDNHTRCDCRPAPKNSIFAPKLIDCHCPKDFRPVPSSSECRCDCDKKQSKACRRIKRGKRSYHSKGCHGNCGPPACDYGRFKATFARCPRKNDKGRRRK